jgi:hypothetical protein
MLNPTPKYAKIFLTTESLPVLHMFAYYYRYREYKCNPNTSVTENNMVPVPVTYSINSTGLIFRCSCQRVADKWIKTNPKLCYIRLQINYELGFDYRHPHFKYVPGTGNHKKWAIWEFYNYVVLVRYRTQICTGSVAKLCVCLTVYRIPVHCECAVYMLCQYRLKWNNLPDSQQWSTPI